MESIWSEFASMDPWQTSVLNTRTLLRRLTTYPFVAGAGKSVLWYANSLMLLTRELTVSASATIIKEIEMMRKSGLASLAMFYHDFREDKKKNLRGLLSSVLVQLCRQSDSYCDILSKLYSDHENGSQDPSDDELVQCLQDLLEVPGQAPIYLIIDALDECPNTSAVPSPREKVLTLVKQLIESRLANLHICVTVETCDVRLSSEWSKRTILSFYL
jgi:hypothetical protein